MHDTTRDRERQIIPRADVGSLIRDLRTLTSRQKLLGGMKYPPIEFKPSEKHAWLQGDTNGQLKVAELVNDRLTIFCLTHDLNLE